MNRPSSAGPKALTRTLVVTGRICYTLFMVDRPRSRLSTDEELARQTPEDRARRQRMMAQPGPIFSGDEARAYAQAVADYRATGDENIFVERGLWT